MARTRKPAAAKPPKAKPRIISRPGILPTSKDTVTKTLLNGIDELGERFRRASEGRSTWKVKKGNPGSVWVAHVRIEGEWDWDALHNVATSVESLKAVYKDISDRRLAFVRLHFVQYDKDGIQVNEGWYAPSPLTRWENLVKSLQEETDSGESGSRAARYENTVVDTIMISFASRATS